MTATQQLIMCTGFCLLLCFMSSQGWKVDCTKFVFAPRCRGVAAKRNVQLLSTSTSNKVPQTSLLSQLTQMQRRSNDEIKSHAYRLDLLLSEPNNDLSALMDNELSGLVADEWQAEDPDYESLSRENTQIRRLKAYIEALATDNLLGNSNTDLTLNIGRS